MNKMIGINKVREKNQLTIPQEVIEKFNLQIGDHVAFVYENNHLVLKKVNTKVDIEDFKL